MPGFPLPGFCQYFDDNGDPVNGGLLYTRAAGTSTPLATYSNQGLTTPNANPIVLDSAGRARIFVEDGVSYKLILHDSDDVLIREEDGWGVPEIEPAPTPAEVPSGGIIMFGAAAAPSGYLLCDGTAVSRTTYADLFAVIGTTFGPGNGSTTFNIPDFRQRFPMGVAASGTGNSLGATAGTIDHVHTGPAHTHTIAAHSHTMAHTHTISRDGWGSVINTPPVDGRIQTGGSGSGSEASTTQATVDTTSGASSATNTGTAALTTDSGGTANTGSANPPLLAVNFIIKT